MTQTKFKFPPVLDVCCGSKAFWFSKHDGRALFIDKRMSTIPLIHSDRPRSPVVINPDVQADFTNLPLPDESFVFVVFDPPHILEGSTGNLAKYYGVLDKDWSVQLRKGFSECFRVIKPEGVLIFKWNETSVALNKVVKLAKHKPLFGHKSGKASKTHWIVFIKP